MGGSKRALGGLEERHNDDGKELGGLDRHKDERKDS